MTTFSGTRKTWHLRNNLNQSIVWIEGIGSIYGPIYTTNIFCDMCVMTSCYNQWGTNLFLTCAFKDYMQVYQNTVCSVPPVWMAIPFNSFIYLNAGGINERKNESHMIISPNPNDGIAYLKINNASIQGLFNLSIYNAIGQIVSSMNLAGIDLTNDLRLM